MKGHPQQVTVSAGTAFKIGFFGFWGAFAGALVPWIIVVVLGGALIASLTRH